MNQIYITKTAHYLPNQPVSNGEIEEYLGQICNKGSRAKAIVLRNNRITNRHYALTKRGTVTHSNAELTLESIQKLFDDGFKASDLELLSVGTSTPDTLMPSHGLLVHNLIKDVKSIPVYTSSGVCCSSMHAFETAYHALELGKVNNAICAGSELLSPLLRSDFFELEGNKLQELNSNAIIAFEKDFLRFMLSDGSGAFLLENKPRKGINYQIEWVESASFANKLPSCMYQGCEKDENGQLISWKLMDPNEWGKKSVFAIKQDTRILENIIPLAVEFFENTMKKHNLDPESIKFFLPHISSMYFYDKLVTRMQEKNISVPREAYFCCLPEIGNIGSASIYATLNILDTMGDINPGDYILLGVPESAQFQYSLALLKAVFH